ncbi:MAG: hypothetical protein KAT43_03550 [Nanoarchaeota archaeon]|nr:hypothetical protein [Nanoarchaeota archaeon]
MEVGNAEQYISSKVNGFMSIFNFVLDKLFIQKTSKLNVTIVLNEIKKREIDLKKIQEFMDTLPDGEWNLKIFVDNIEKLSEIFGVSDEDILQYSVEPLHKKDMSKFKWELLISSMLEYSKFATQFYDALKYNKSGGLSLSRIKLLNEMMKVFKLIKEVSKEIYERYHEKQLTPGGLKKFNELILPLEFLMLRILYISLNLQEANDDKFGYFAKLLGTERIVLLYNIKTKPRYN